MTLDAVPSRANRRLPPEPLSWPLLPSPREGALAFPGLEQSVSQAIRIILLTRPGEMLLHPSFGAGLDTFLHEPNTLTTRRRIRDRIQEALSRWERRILLDSVEVWELDGEPDLLRVEIAYRLRRTGAAAALALSLTLSD